MSIRPVAAVATLLASAAMIALGSWQLQRLSWKEALIAKVESRLGAAPVRLDDALAREAAGEDMEYQPVRIEGVFAHDLEAHVFGTHEGAAGAFVFTPLDAAAPGGGRRFVYVNRGFAPQAFRDAAARASGQVSGEVVVEGLLRRAETPPPIARRFLPADQPDDNLWFRRDPEVLAERHGVATIPFYIDSYGRESAAPWPKGGTTRVEFSNRHLEYALTWFSLAAALLAVFVAFSLKRARPGEE